MPIREGIYYEGHMAEAKSVSFTSPLYFFFFDCSVMGFRLSIDCASKEKNLIMIDYLSAILYIAIFQRDFIHLR